MTELPEFYDITWTDRRDGTKIRLLTKDGIQTFDAPFRPYCYLQERDVRPDVLRVIQSIDETAELEPVSVNQAMVMPNYRSRPNTFYDKDFQKVKLARPNLVRELRQELNQLGVPSFQSDVPYARRVMIDLDQSISAPDEILAFDIEVEADEGVPDPEAADKQIFTICAVGSDGEEFAFAEDDEESTIEGFLEVAEEYQAILGWNSFKFDYPYLRNRCRNLGISFDWFKVVHVDALPTYQYILLKSQPNYRLDTVARNEFGMEYEGVDFSRLREIFENDREQLIEYNLDDARVVMRLNNRYKMKNITFDILASAGYCRPKDIFFLREDLDYQRVTKSSNVLIEGVVLGLSDDVIWPNKGSAREDFEGARVLEPKPGLYDRAVTLDFSSMYPSIISALNIGPETFRPDGSGDIKAPIGSFVSEPQSIFSEAYHVLKDQRDLYTEQCRRFTRGSPEWTIAKSYSSGIKQYVNTFYGVIGSPYSRFYNRDVAENITKMGQYMLQRTADFAEECGYTVIYGDTDSVIVELREDGDPVEEAHRLGRLFSAEIRRFVADEYNGDPELINLTVDEVYAPFFITDAKKRYTGYCIYDGEPCFTFEKTGFESVRGDYCDASKQFQEELIHAILQDGDEWELIDDWKARLYAGELDEMLVKHVGLRRKPENYSSKPPHVRVAERFEGTEDEFRVGDKIPYIKYGNDPEKVVAVRNGDTPRFNITNYEYLWEKNFKNMIERFGLERHKGTVLTDFS